MATMTKLKIKEIDNTELIGLMYLLKKFMEPSREERLSEIAGELKDLGKELQKLGEKGVKHG